jgi:hypothetical protein
MKYFKAYSAFVAAVLFSAIAAAQNPIIRNQFTADPTARLFKGEIYVFPSHDIPAPADFKRKDWFCMEDYHVFSSSNLTDWKDHGMILNQKNVNWVDAATYSMWAPDCVERNGKYYLYFPANVKSGVGRGFGIGVAIADDPAGPYVPQAEPVKDVHGIDPNVLIDKDGKAYLYWSQGNIYVARLKDDMLSLDSEPKIVGDLPGQGLKEGPFVFERNGVYYMTYPHVQNKTERLEYAIGDNPMGPFKVTGVIMDESPTGCWTNHHSVISYNNQWYLFYHHNDLSPKFDKNRSVRVDSLFFNSDNTIRKVVPTLRGVGITNATGNIEIDRFSNISPAGASVEFLDPDDRFGGWKTILKGPEAWVQYNAVDFGSKKLRKAVLKARSESGSIIEIRLDNQKGPLLATVKVPAGQEWTEINSGLQSFSKGIHNIYLSQSGTNSCEIDRVRFTK